MLHTIPDNSQRPVWFAVATFAVLLTITQYVAFERYLISKDRERELLGDELIAVQDRFRKILNNDITAANTLAIIYKEYGTPKNFDSIAKQIVHNGSNYVDALQLTNNGIIQNVYPPVEYQSTVGINTRADSLRLREEQEALTKDGIYFAGPRQLRMGGEGILAKVPIVVNNEVAALAVVLTKMSTIEKALDLNNGKSKFAYRLSKVGGRYTGMHYLTAARPYDGSEFESVAMPEGNWVLSIGYTTPGSRANIFWLAALGVVVSMFGAAMVYSRSIQRLRLQQSVAMATHDLGERVKELSTIFQTNEILKDDKQTIGEVFQRIVDILPPGWQYPGVCAAKVMFNKRAYTTNNYRESRYKQTAELHLQDGRSGYIEVCYLQEMPAAYEGPFLKEERSLINTIAETIEIYFNKKRHEDTVRMSEANLRSIIDSSQVGFMLCDTGLNIIAANKRMANNYQVLSGRPLVVGDDFIEALLPDRKQRVQQLLAQVIVGGAPVEYDTSYVVDTKTIHITVSIAPVVNDNQIIGICMAAYDITARKQMELERQRIIDDLQKRNRALEHFAHMVSHEVRAPLATLMGLSGLIKEAADEEEHQVMVNGIVESSYRLDNVLKDLNDILRVKAE
ncbi:PAS domain-containing protein [Polluticoccus soli]|uniref:PAS domain-containing protein n=1 Tax=Polluticoccus soli TaxID=3034150 RepID=UPI0023E14FC7|nr:PAS domain-containing protein [Flavipsychrobacter sp. JY13-12]